MDDIIRVGAIGSGYWGPNLIRNFAEIPTCRLEAVADLDLGRLAAIRQRHRSIELTTTDHRELLDAGLDAVVICTPAHTHYEIARDCLEQGLHVLIEKPMVTCAEDARALIDLADRNDRVLMVGHTFEYNAAVRELKRMMTDGELGDVRYIDAVRVGLGLYNKTVNVVWDLAPHDVSIVLHLLDAMPEHVAAEAVACVTDDVEDVAYFTLMFSNGVMAHARVSWLDPSKTRRITVVGSEKMVIYDDVEPNEKLKVYDKGVETLRSPDNFGEFQFNYRYGDIVSPFINFQEPLRVEAEHFLECIVENRAPLTDGRNGLRVVQVIEALQESLRRRGEPVSLAPTTGPSVARHPSRGPRLQVAGVDPRQNGAHSPSVNLVNGHAAKQVLADDHVIDLRPSALSDPPTRTVEFVDLAADHAAYRDELDAAIAAVVDRGDFVLGEATTLFEHEFAAYCGADFGVGTDSGFSAIELILRAHGIGHGDEVITAANTFYSTVRPIEACGARPVLVDADPLLRNLDPTRIEEAITPATRAIIAVHLYGHPADMDAIRAIADRHGLLVFEDACQAHGSRYRDRRAGSLAHAAAFSFYPSKNLGALGDAGMVVTSDGEVAERIRNLRNLGSVVKYRHEGEGFNRRLDTLHAAALRVKLPHLDAANERRRTIASWYRVALADLDLELPSTADWAEHVFHLYVIEVAGRDVLGSQLDRHGVKTGIHYPTPIHLIPAFASLGYREGDFPVAERLAASILSLPMHPHLTESDVEYVRDAIGRELATLEIAAVSHAAGGGAS